MSFQLACLHGECSGSGTGGRSDIESVVIAS
jgi:hypothetical protein